MRPQDPIQSILLDLLFSEKAIHMCEIYTCTGTTLPLATHCSCCSLHTSKPGTCLQLTTVYSRERERERERPCMAWCERVNCSLMSISHGSSASRRWSRMHVHVHRVLAYRGTRGNSWSYSDIRTTSLLLYLTHWKHQILYSCLLFISGGLYSCLRSTHIYSCMC